MTRDIRAYMTDAFAMIVWIVWMLMSFGFIAASSTVIVVLLTILILMIIPLIKDFNKESPKKKKTTRQKIITYTEYAMIILGIFGQLVFGYYLLLYYIILIVIMYHIRPDLFELDKTKEDIKEDASTQEVQETKSRDGFHVKDKK